MFYKLILLATLYTSQFIPTTFFIQALPVFMRQQNMSLDVIGYMGLLMLPSGLKFLWAPFIVATTIISLISVYLVTRIRTVAVG
ncbi:hypothetical protein DSM106972_019450 [Dulcicalothrix desertica PCC 7102]|uniref:Major facilitator superfamily (MFS) profile domain-containing protein n=1 Tax=Dulcicalothrix desertica PCC 7102 TaxID=232991 RepID=A0A3S1DCW4_9CYAN|nr:hypothetical protein DSM106972_019450 [Dulcicalothrix desertica PCC 7102]TWH39857.1 hypothetical protein CAL7102_09120 [Dulcicalothrix desertica PCC 7102]